MLGEIAKLSTTVAMHVNIATLSHPSLLNLCVCTGRIAGGGGSEIERKVQSKVTEVVPAYSGPLGWTVTVTLGVGTVHNGMNNQDWIQNYVLVFILLAYPEESDPECCSF